MIMKKRNLILPLAVAVLLLLVFACNSCSGITKVTDVITNPTAREVYAREYRDNKPAFEAWASAYDAALADSLAIALPYGERGAFTPWQNVAHSYVLELQEGRVLQAAVQKDSLRQRVFMDLLEWDGNAYRKIESTRIDESYIEFEVKDAGTYKLVVQPEIEANSNFFISITERPLYGFPVAGKTSAAIQSFWGMERDGGRRKHEGIDIFAKRGTPVVAAADGIISYTGERGLGGKQVWLRDGIFGASLYYAHLDRIAVTGGTRVKTGDTLGFVGNTGNAKFTPPHLHFGIYKGYGAVDPLPFVYEGKEISPSQFPLNYRTALLKVKSKANLRKGPSTVSGIIGSVSASDAVTLLGQAKDWLHIRTAAGQKAFLHKSLAREAR